ncbi:mechanosensitive ion channel domain-containing protein [Salinisphaera sp. SPP-AMP-43]|uniref:mechanosensitive ion channel domain-containing protein n=1 Tax=Salinisphaera sp. SPP-AMP-43 TaxID=3121288 RepID=UPI003C6E5B1A
MEQHDASSAMARLMRVFIGFSLIMVMLAAPMAQAQPSAKPSQETAEQSVSLDQLANLLENNKTRKQLIQQLRQAAAHEGQGAVAESPEAKAGDTPAAAIEAPDQAEQQKAASEKRVSFARRFAEITASWSETIGARIGAAWNVVVDLAKSGNAQHSAVSFKASVFFDALLMFAIVVGATLVALLVLRLLASTIFAAIGRFAARGKSGSGSLVRRSSAILVGIVVDIVVVLLAGGAGYMAGLYAIGDNGTMGTRESLFINAFVLVELVKVAIRALFAARYDSLRLLNIESSIAGWWSIRLRWFVGVIGYGLLVAVPIVNAQLSFFLGAVLTFLVMGAAYVYALKVIFSNRKLLTERLKQKAETASIGFFSVLYRLFARLWVLLAVIYFTWLFVASQIDPAGALPFMLSATIQTALIAGIGVGLSGLLSRAIGHRMVFPDSIRDKLPMLEARVNSYVPTALKVIRVVIMIVVIAMIANAWTVFDLNGWLSSSAGLTMLSVSAKVTLILVASALLWLVAASVIEHRLSPNTGRGAPTARQQTLLVLFRNALAILIATFTIMITLSQIGVNIGPLIAGAGVFGLAIGFGAQKLVQDIITGVFIQLENAMNTGDVVTVGGVTGTAERLTIRSVSIRDIDGAYHIVPFSSASVVSNFMRDWAYFRTEYGVAYREDIDNAIYYLREAFDDLKTDPDHGPNILEDMTVPGVTALADSSVNIRIMIKTKPGTQWGVGRAFNRLVKIHFDRAGIEIPFPHQTLWFGEDRHGHSPAANVRLLEDGEEGADTEYRPKRRRRGDDAAPEETGDAPS